MSLTSFKRKKLQQLLIGGRFNTQKRPENIFTGCIQGMEVGIGSRDYVIAMKNLVTKYGRKATMNCNFPDPCKGHRCPLQSECVANFNQALCKCNKGMLMENV